MLIHKEETIGFIDVPSSVRTVLSIFRKRPNFSEEEGRQLAEFHRISLIFSGRFERLPANEEKKLITAFHLMSQTYGHVRKHFCFLIKNNIILFITRYNTAIKYYIETKNPRYRNAEEYPNQKKMRMAIKAAQGSLRRFICRSVRYLKENPVVLYSLPVTDIRNFLEKHNTLALTIYGAKLNRRAWLDTTIADVLRGKYEEYRVSWKNIIMKCFPFPEEVGRIIAEFSSESIDLNGMSFVDFFRNNIGSMQFDWKLTSVTTPDGVEARYNIILN